MIVTRTFHSILFDKGDRVAANEPLEPPAYVADLHLNDILRAVTGGRDAGELARVFHAPLGDVGAIEFRHAVFRDLETDVLLDAVRTFNGQMEVVQRRIAQASGATYRLDRERWLLGSAEGFGAAVGALNDRLRSAHPRSVALSGFRDYLASYVGSEAFTSLVADTRRVRATLAAVSYRLRIHGSKITVTRARDEPDFSAEILETFRRFRQAEAHKRYQWRFDQRSNMDHVEAGILERVERQNPDAFAELHAYAERHRAFLDPVVARFDRESRFYVAWLELIERLRRGAGLPFCYPQVTAGSHAVEGRRIFDLALAVSLVAEGQRPVLNDVALEGRERVLLVSGPNQGGKTTFARAVGQLHHLALIGVPVPGERISLPLVDRIFTHFERQEQVEDLTSRLEDDLRRIHAILEQATSRSLVIMNESFSSTTVADQLFIGHRVLRQVVDRGLICVIVTFLDELATLDPAVVSMVGSVDPREPARRTFEIVRRPPIGLAYAQAIAEKHALTYPSVKARLAR